MIIIIIMTINSNDTIAPTAMKTIGITEVPIHLVISHY